MKAFTSDSRVDGNDAQVQFQKERQFACNPTVGNDERAALGRGCLQMRAKVVAWFSISCAGRRGRGRSGSPRRTGGSAQCLSPSAPTASSLAVRPCERS